jgi:hypothetical protein
MKLDVNTIRQRERDATRTIALLFFGLFHYFITFACSAQ